MSSSTTINGVDTAALDSTIAAVREDRSLGEVTFAVNGRWDGGFRLAAATGTLVQGSAPDTAREGRFAMRSDEPLALLGTDTAVSPGEYVLQALAGCYTVTLAANAAARGIHLDGYRLELQADFDLAAFLGIAPDQPAGASEIRVKVDLDAPGATRAELEELVELVEQRSPIRDTLARPVSVVTELARA